MMMLMPERYVWVWKNVKKSPVILALTAYASQLWRTLFV